MCKVLVPHAPMLLQAPTTFGISGIELLQLLLMMNEVLDQQKQKKAFKPLYFE